MSATHVLPHTHYTCECVVKIKEIKYTLLSSQLIFIDKDCTEIAQNS